jgi:hypothetical protein
MFHIAMENQSKVIMKMSVTLIELWLKGKMGMLS